MSYEGKMLQDYNMPTRSAVEQNLLIALFKHGGVIKEFSSNEKIVAEIAGNFDLNEEQKKVVLERIYKKENRTVRTPLWHRLLYRAGDALAKEKLVIRPTKTLMLTNKKEWMLTEQGYDKALKLQNIPSEYKEDLPIKSFEVQKMVKRIIEQQKPSKYNPIAKAKKTKEITVKFKLRSRGFRQAIIEAYDYRCCICGLKLCSLDKLQWEVQAAHIIPHRFFGKDDIWNGLALCQLHHWAFDVGLFSFNEDLKLISSLKSEILENDHGMIFNFSFLDHFQSNNCFLRLPKTNNHYPDIAAINWHRNNIYSS